MKSKKKAPIPYDLGKEFAALGNELKSLMNDSENVFSTYMIVRPF